MNAMKGIEPRRLFQKTLVTSECVDGPMLGMEAVNSIIGQLSGSVSSLNYNVACWYMVLQCDFTVVDLGRVDALLDYSSGRCRTHWPKSITDDRGL